MVPSKKYTLITFLWESSVYRDLKKCISGILHQAGLEPFCCSESVQLKDVDFEVQIYHQVAQVLVVEKCTHCIFRFAIYFLQLELNSAL